MHALSAHNYYYIFSTLGTNGQTDLWDFETRIGLVTFCGLYSQNLDDLIKKKMEFLLRKTSATRYSERFLTSPQD